MAEVSADESISVDTVSPGQVIAARAYIRRIGDAALVSSKIATVAGLPLDEVKKAWAEDPTNLPEQVQAAQLLIELRGGEEYVEPHVAALAHTKLAGTGAGGR